MVIRVAITAKAIQVSEEQRRNDLTAKDVRSVPSLPKIPSGDTPIMHGAPKARRRHQSAGEDLTSICQSSEPQA